MKKAEQYLKEYVGRRYPNTDYNSEEVDIMEAIKQAQIDAIEETVKLCAENAKLLFHDGYWKENKELEYFQSGENNLQISKNSILNYAEILKKRL